MNEATEKTNKNNPSAVGVNDSASDAWSPVSRSASERREVFEREAEQRVMRERYKEEYRGKLRAQSEQSDEPTSPTSAAKEQLIKDIKKSGSSLFEDFVATRRAETDKRFDEAEAKLKNLAEAAKNAKQKAEADHQNSRTDTSARADAEQISTKGTEKTESSSSPNGNTKKTDDSTSEFVIHKDYSGYSDGKISFPGADFVITYAPTPDDRSRVDLDNGKNDTDVPSAAFIRRDNRSSTIGCGADFSHRGSGVSRSDGYDDFTDAYEKNMPPIDEEWQAYSPKKSTGANRPSADESELSFPAYSDSIDDDSADVDTKVFLTRKKNRKGDATYPESDYGKNPPYNAYAHPYGAESDATEPHREVDYGKNPPYNAYAHPYGAESDVTDAQRDINYRKNNINFNYFGNYDDIESPDGVSSGEARFNSSADYRYTAENGRYNHDTDFSYDEHSERAGTEYSHLSYLSEDDERAAYTDARDKYGARIEEEEYLRFLRENEMRDSYVRRKSKDTQSKGRSAGTDKESESVFAAINRSKDTVASRMEYNLRMLEYKWQMHLLTFGPKEPKAEKEARKNARLLEKIRKNQARAVALDEKASIRYYSVLKNTPSDISSADLKRAEYIRSAIESLLLERDDVNLQLSELYNSSTYSGGTRVDRKASKIRISTAKKVYRSQRAIARKLERLHAPTGLKKKIYTLMNDKTEAYSTIEYSRYILKRKDPVGDSRSELKRDIKRAKKTVRFISQDIDHLFKEAAKHHQRRKDNIKQGFWFALVLVILGLGYLAFRYFDFIKGLFLK